VYNRKDQTTVTTVNLTAAKKHAGILSGGLLFRKTWLQSPQKYSTDSIGSAQFTYGGGTIVYVADALNEPKQFYEDDISLLDGEKAQEAVI
jgi:hypothetical protein